MKLLSNENYAKDVQIVSNLDYSWDKLRGSTILITGATGLIGSFLIDVLMNQNNQNHLQCYIIALGRNYKKAYQRFGNYFESEYFSFKEIDINNSISIEEGIDYIIHAASNTHPLAYSNDPIGTIKTNVFATNNLLELAVKKKCKRFVFLSSVEIYGENRGDVDYFEENYCGLIDCNTLRAGYPESKRVGESLCQAYLKQYGLHVVIPRLSRTFGPTMLLDDSKALSQFILKAVYDQDIVLKSEGTQFYSYEYVGDAVSGVLKILFDGKMGESYNVTNPECDIRLFDLAHEIAAITGKKVVFEIPDVVESAGYSKATKALLGIHKIETIGWKPIFSMHYSLSQTISILKDIVKGITNE